MQDLGGGERTTGFELTEGVKTSGGPEICQEYPGTLRRNSMRECREGGLNMNFMESYFCQVSSLSPCLLSILHPYLYPMLSSSIMPNSTYDPLDHNPPGSSVPGIFQARILEWVSISGNLPDPGIEPISCVSCIAGGFSTTEPSRKPHLYPRPLPFSTRVWWASPN